MAMEGCDHDLKDKRHSRLHQDLIQLILEDKALVRFLWTAEKRILSLFKGCDTVERGMARREALAAVKRSLAKHRVRVAHEREKQEVHSIWHGGYEGKASCSF